LDFTAPWTESLKNQSQLFSPNLSEKSNTIQYFRATRYESCEQEECDSTSVLM
jgi:hypothetical protein